MVQLIILFGILIFAAGVSLLIRPALIMDLIKINGEKIWIYVAAIGVRAVLGAVLIQQADISRYPLIIEILGWISLFAAFVLTIIGRPRFTRLMFAIIEKMNPFARVGGLAAVAFGAFLVYAFI